MTRLSIVIPSPEGPECFEATLASVLQNRPAHSEIIVLQSRGYDDPYDLAAEVRFVEVPNAACLADMLNGGLRVARGSIVHLLSCGAEVTEGWTEPAMTQFCDPSIGCVAPRIVHDQFQPPRDVLAFSVDATGGVELVERTDRSDPRKRSIIGPTSIAGFYRRDALLAQDGFSLASGSAYLGLDAAIQLRQRGYQCVTCVDSTIQARQLRLMRETAYTLGRQAELRFWRQMAIDRTSTPWLQHGMTVVHQLVTRGYRPSSWLHFLGRVHGGIDILTSRGDHMRHMPESDALPIRSARQEAAADNATETERRPEHQRRTKRRAA